MESAESKRTNLACGECRKRKRKCDGVQPVCGLCQAQNRECGYTLERNSRKRKWNAEYVSSLENQIASLNAYIKELQGGPRRQEEPADDLDELTQHPAHETRLSSAVEEVGSMLWKINIEGEGQTSFIGPSGNFCFRDSASEVFPTSQGQQGNSQNPGDAQLSYATCSQDQELKNELVDLFSRHLNPIHQFVEESSVTAIALSSSQELPDLLIRSAIFAAGSRYSRRSNAAQIGDIFASFAESIALQCSRSQPSLTVVQALSIICWREMSLDHSNMAWMYNCMVASLSVHLGIHVVDFGGFVEEADSKFTDDRILRIRTFWQGFVIDRMATSMFGRQCAIPVQRVRTPPFESILSPTPTLEEMVFGLQCKLWFLHDKYMDQIYSFDFDELECEKRNQILLEAREKFANFYHELNESLRHLKHTQSICVVMLNISYQMSVLLIHRPYLRRETAGGLSRLAVRAMTTAATSVTRLIRDYRKIGQFREAPFHLVHNILTAAIMHLLTSTTQHQTLRRQSVIRFRVCVEALDEMRYTWPQSQRAIRLLQDLAGRWSVMSALPMRLSYPPTFNQSQQETIIVPEPTELGSSPSDGSQQDTMDSNWDPATWDQTAWMEGDLNLSNLFQMQDMLNESDQLANLRGFGQSFDQGDRLDWQGYGSF